MFSRVFKESRIGIVTDGVERGRLKGADIGLGVGANDSIEEHNQDIADCLSEKGYEVVADAA